MGKRSLIRTSFDRGTPGGDYSCRVKARMSHDGTIEIISVKYQAPPRKRSRK